MWTCTQKVLVVKVSLIEFRFTVKFQSHSEKDDIKPMILFIEKNFFLNCHDFCLSTSVLRRNALVLLPLKQSYVSTLIDELCVRRGAVLGQHKPLCSPECHAGIYIWTSCLCSELVHVCYPDVGKGLTKIIFWSGPLLLRHMSVKCKRFCFALLKKETNLKIFEICYSSRMSGDFRHMYCKKRGWCSVFQWKNSNEFCHAGSF